MSSIKDKAANAGEAIADTAKNVGQKVKDGVSDAAAFVKDKLGIGCDANGPSDGVAGIRERMEVYASCGKKMGVVDHVEGNAIKLTRNDSPDGQHHLIPASWIGRVHENHVHLTKTSAETEKSW